MEKLQDHLQIMETCGTYSQTISTGRFTVHPEIPEELNIT